jgi:hypothetical protein
VVYAPPLLRRPVADPESLELARDREVLERALEGSVVEGLCALCSSLSSLMEKRRAGGRKSRSVMETYNMMYVP